MRTPPARLLLAGCVALALASCQSPPEITGRVTPRAPVRLPANAVLEVQVSDVSRADAAPVVVAKRAYARIGEAPWRFTLRADSLKALDRTRVYAVQARVVVDGKPALVSKRRTLVDPARLADTLDVVVEAVPRTIGAVPGTPAPPGALRLWNPPGRPVTLAAPIPPPVASPAGEPSEVPAAGPLTQSMRPE